VYHSGIGPIIEITNVPSEPRCQADIKRLVVSVTHSSNFVPLFNHALVSESIANPSLDHIDRIRIDDWYSNEESPPKAPQDLRIVNEDDTLVTLGQSVEEVHKYLNGHIGFVKRIKGMLYGRMEIRADECFARVIT
jgi:hypothetical protein